MKRTKTGSLLTAAAAVAGVAMGAGIALAAHPPIQLYTYEEVGQQYGMGNTMPVMVDPTTHQGFPYSPKQTCGLAGCHDGKTTVSGTGTKYDGTVLKSYDDLSKHAFHASLGFNEWMDNDQSGLFIGDGTGVTPAGTQTGLNPQKPWLQSHGHNGKW